MCLFQVQHKLTSLYIPFTVLKDLSIVLWMCLSLQTVSFKEFSRIVYVFHCSVIKVPVVLFLWQLLYYIKAVSVCQDFFIFSFAFFKRKRRRRDLNPRTAQTVYTLSRGTSSATWVLLLMPEYLFIFNYHFRDALTSILNRFPYVKL